MAIHGVSSATALKTPTPAAARLLSEKKAQAQQVIDRNTERARERGNVVPFQERMGNASPAKRKKGKTDDVSSNDALKQRESILAHRHHMYDNTSTAIAVAEIDQKKRAISNYGPHYNYLAAIHRYSNTAVIGYQQARKVATTINLVV